ncbi:NAD(P)-dependent dehydrogenase, short-chain alcohol dehydrogenase family [Pseudooceanicola antarcticus]|uniref:NAD(P)-dependent dehydrogenase, short-chain alcohol dehydrogenase family n=1 Tax=Pseudooceanicola antarcticus TaxID=1247613 RepID=A0A285IQU7_9RHOB|nr:SDR family oxidoreductase [Pseudooceanicola antarcticus]PJE31792.1 short chain dehydrogenase [Pseudooceanicola antarcticus]SNY50400.1 NAD(P)-dependent dehydrogenase, short-chain alcohol dehydrogenase family [Pseudooceanicola antarcticus]
MSPVPAKKALVTGAGRRLGRAMALTLAEEGHDVAIHYHGSAEAAEEVAGLIRGMGRQATTLQADLTSEAEVEPLIGLASEALGGPLTCLINNASAFDYDNIRTASRASWDRHMEANLRAPFLLTQLFAAQAPAAGTDERGEPLAHGLVVQMLDQRVHKLTPEFMSYTISKLGLWAFTQTAAQALAPAVRVNAIGPGPTLQGARQSDAHFAAQRRNTVLERGSNAEDICGALRYFLGAKGVTGQLICTDGGQHLGWRTPDVQGVE